MQAQLIDVCLGCFINDHHDRPGELLLGVYVDGSTSRHDVMSGAIDEMRQIGFDRLPEMVEGMTGTDAAKAAIKTLFCESFGTTPEALAKPFDPTLEVPSGDSGLDGGDYCQAWFLLTWEVEEVEA